MGLDGSIINSLKSPKVFPDYVELQQLLQCWLFSIEDRLSEKVNSKPLPVPKPNFQNPLLSNYQKSSFVANSENSLCNCRGKGSRGNGAFPREMQEKVCVLVGHPGRGKITLLFLGELVSDPRPYRRLFISFIVIVCICFGSIHISLIISYWFVMLNEIYFSLAQVSSNCWMLILLIDGLNHLAKNRSCFQHAKRLNVDRVLMDASFRW